MKKLLGIFVVLLSFSQITKLHAQETLRPDGGGSYEIQQAGPCLSDANRSEIKKRLLKNIDSLGLNSIPLKSFSSSYSWPLEKSVDLNFNSCYGIINFVDQNPTSNILDHNCGNRTYNAHRGSDYITWPFPWYIYHNDFVSVVAAEKGVIVGKDNDNYDKNCSWGSGEWNGVYLRHEDGFMTWYGHMKLNSLTTKKVGAAVEKGEYLGMVGSSGNSTAPHLHFEVYNAANFIVDPYNGSCATWETCWEDQPEYREPTVNAVLTHSSPPIFGCPDDMEFPNLSDKFLPGDTVITAVYFQDQIRSQVYSYSLIDPFGNIWRDWEHDSDETLSVAYWYWNWLLPNNGPFGVWSFQVERNNEFFRHEFVYGTSVNTSELDNNHDIAIFPNPSDGKFYLSKTLDLNSSIDIINQEGQVSTVNYELDAIDLSEHPAGVYYLKIKEAKQSLLKKIVIIR